MNNVSISLTLQQIKEKVKNHPIQKVKIAVVDIDGILRGKYLSTDKFLSVLDHDMGFCDVVWGWDCQDKVYMNAPVSGVHLGYPDAPMVIDLSTMREIPWENNTLFFLGKFVTKEGQPAPFCPRQLLAKLQDQALGLGFVPYCAQEFEWFNFKETPKSASDKDYRKLEPISPGMFGYSILRTSLLQSFFEDLYRYLHAFNIPVEGLHTETGPGVLEVAIAYSQLMEAADRAVLFKTATKEIAYKHGIMATFMAKISPNLPGCGGHIHQSLWSADKQVNLFHDATDKNGMSQLMKHYIAGQLHCLPHLLPMLAPTINSYKRLVVGSWAPVNLTWGVDNRTVSLRSLPTGKKSARLETRIVGADVNPYLAMAACLGAGLYGIQNKLPLQPETKGNGYEEKKYGVLLANLAEATNVMKNSNIARSILGEAFVEQFCFTRLWECKQFDMAVTDWEYQRYFEII
ncbi:MAG: glutamine synthetase family protein [Phycisphaerales bacterium]|nr:glutamine synthetase family protein [Phycisphaerales bacterium]